MTDQPTPDAAPATPEAEKGKKSSNAVWMGTAVGVGSAALVAALMYANRRSTKKR